MPRSSRSSLGRGQFLRDLERPIPLQNEILSRLASRALASPDETSPKLQELFIGDITSKLKQLKKALRMLVYTSAYLYMYVILSLIFAFIEVQWPYIVANFRKVSFADDLSMRMWNAIPEAARSARWAVVSFLESHTMQSFGLYLSRPAAVLLFEAANIGAIIFFIDLAKSLPAPPQVRAPPHIEEAGS